MPGVAGEGVCHQTSGPWNIQADLGHITTR